MPRTIYCILIAYHTTAYALCIGAPRPSRFTAFLFSHAFTEPGTSTTSTSKMTCNLAITSMSLGWADAGHCIEDKLTLAHRYGYKGIELFWDDLRDLAMRRFQDTPTGSTPDDAASTNPTAEPSHAAQKAAACHIQTLCKAFDIHIICLQPFAGYEGLLDREVKKQLMEKLGRWFELARALGTDMIQIPSSLAPATAMSDDLDVIVQDLQHIADLGAAQISPIRFVYEALCFGTRVDRWEVSWDVVKRVNRSNFGLCLDSFNIAGRIYADPASVTGKTPDAEEAVRRSLELMVQEIDISKVFYVQIVDAERLTAPLEEQSFYDPTQIPRMNWSRNCRLFYGEEDRGAYLPIREIADTFFHKLGFHGWVSLELFNRRMKDRGDHVTEQLAERGAISWSKLVRDVGLKTDHPPISMTEEPSLRGEDSSVADEASSPEFIGRELSDRDSSEEPGLPMV